MAKTTLTPEQFTAVCDGISQGGSLRSSCKEAEVSTQRFLRALASDEDGARTAQYMRAREARADARFEKLDEILEDLRSGVIDPQQARVMMDAIKWQTGKEKARVYGDKVEVAGDPDKPIKISFK